MMQTGKANANTFLRALESAVSARPSWYILHTMLMCADTLPDGLLKKISSVGPDDGMDHGASGCTLFEYVLSGTMLLLHESY